MLDIRNQTATAPVREDTAPPPRTRRRLVDQISGFEAVGIFVFWLVSTTWLAAIAPAPEAAQPPLIVGLNVAFNVGFLGALAGAATRRRFALAGSLVAGGVMAVMATMCGLDGHTGLWIPAQGILGAGAFAYGVHRLRS